MNAYFLYVLNYHRKLAFFIVIDCLFLRDHVNLDLTKFIIEFSTIQIKLDSN